MARACTLATLFVPRNQLASSVVYGDGQDTPFDHRQEGWPGWAGLSGWLNTVASTSQYRGRSRNLAEGAGFVAGWDRLTLSLGKSAVRLLNTSWWSCWKPNVYQYYYMAWEFVHSHQSPDKVDGWCHFSCYRKIFNVKNLTQMYGFVWTCLTVSLLIRCWWGEGRSSLMVMNIWTIFCAKYPCHATVIRLIIICIIIFCFVLLSYYFLCCTAVSMTK